MIPFQNLHTHTLFDDGKNSPDDMAEAAIRAGFHSLGFSGHSTVPYDNDWTLKDIPAYLQAITDAKCRFAGKLDIYNGLEWDIISKQDLSPYEYIIGSIHHITIGDEYPSIDDTVEVADDCLARYFDGDKNSMIQAYFAQYDYLAGCDFVDIIGHFDLLNKFSRFDEDSPLYKDCAMAALEKLAAKDKIFEVNTGAMSRGYRTVPYPNVFLLKELQAKKCRVLISSDAHSTNAIGYAFSDMAELLVSLGFHEAWYYTPEGFKPFAL